MTRKLEGRHLEIVVKAIKQVGPERGSVALQCMPRKIAAEVVTKDVAVTAPAFIHLSDRNARHVAHEISNEATLRALMDTLGKESEESARQLAKNLPGYMKARVLGGETKASVSVGQTVESGSESTPNRIANLFGEKALRQAFNEMPQSDKIAYILGNDAQASARLLESRPRSNQLVERVMGPIEVNDRGKVLQKVIEQNPEVAAKIVDAIRSVEQKARAISAIKDPVLEARLVMCLPEDARALVISKMRPSEVFNLAQHMPKEQVISLQSMIDGQCPAADLMVKALKDAELAHDVTERKDAEISNMLKNGNPYEIISLLMEGRNNALAQELEPTRVADIFLKVESAWGAHKLQRMESRRAAGILTEVAKREPEKAASMAVAMAVDETEGRKAAASVVMGMEQQAAAAMMDEMGSKAAAEVVESLFRTSKKSRSAAVEVTRRMDPEKAASMIGEMPSNMQADMIAMIADIGRSTREIWKTRTITGASIIACAVMGQTQLIEQNHGINGNVLTAISTALIGVGGISNWFYRLQQRKYMPKWMPIVGGETLGCTANRHSLSTTAAWAILGTIIQIIQMGLNHL